MPNFAYEALMPDGVVSRGSLPAASEEDLEQTLRAKGQYLLRAEPQKDRSAGSRLTDGRVDRRDLVAFTEYLAGSSGAGLPLLATLEDIEVQLPKRRMRQVVAEVRHAVAEEGKSLSEALAEHPRTFSQLYIGSVAAGEATGHIDYVLEQLVEHLDWQENINAQLRQAMIYPLLVLVGLGLLMLMLVTFVYPRLLPVLTGLGGELPLPTRVMMGVSTFLRSNWVLLFAGALTTGVLYVFLMRDSVWRRRRDWLLLHMPIFGKLIWEVNLARFVTYTSLFYRAGVELVLGLTLVERMIPNVVIGNAVRQAREDVVGGDSMSAAFARTGMFPALVLRSISLGESTGALDESLTRAKLYYDREVPASVKRLLTALQPLLVVSLGVIVLVVALSIFLPIVSIYERAGR